MYRRKERESVYTTNAIGTISMRSKDLKPGIEVGHKVYMNLWFVSNCIFPPVMPLYFWQFASDMSSALQALLSKVGTPILLVINECCSKSALVKYMYKKRRKEVGNNERAHIHNVK